MLILLQSGYLTLQPDYLATHRDDLFTLLAGFILQLSFLLSMQSHRILQRNYFTVLSPQLLTLKLTFLLYRLH